MIDTRNSYKAMKHPGYAFWHLYWRPWFWPLWFLFACESEDQIEARCEQHAAPKIKPTTRHLGKFPRKPNEAA